MSRVDRRRAVGRDGRQVADEQPWLALAADLVDRDHGRPDAVGEPDPLVDPASRVRVLFERQLSRGEHDLARHAVDEVAIRVDAGEVVVLAHGLELSNTLRAPGRDYVLLLLGLDADRAAIEEATSVLAQYGDRVVLRQANFESIYDVAREESFIPLDGVLFDLGLSSYQLADSSRGFSFTADAPPDMRFDEDTGLSALELIDRRRSESSPESSRRLVRNAVRVASRRRSWRRARKGA